jgi:hypothetical protein
VALGTDTTVLLPFLSVLAGNFKGTNQSAKTAALMLRSHFAPLLGASLALKELTERCSRNGQPAQRAVVPVRRFIRERRRRI